MEIIYKLSFDCGRQGTLTGTFIAEQERINDLIESDVHISFGEVLGKHSWIEGPLEWHDIEEVSSDPDEIRIFKKMNLETGHNPLNYPLVEETNELEKEVIEISEEDKAYQDLKEQVENPMFNNRGAYESFLKKVKVLEEKYPENKSFKVLHIDIECKRLDFAGDDFIKMMEERGSNPLFPSGEYLAKVKIRNKEDSKKRWTQAKIDKQEILKGYEKTIVIKEED